MPSSLVNDHANCLVDRESARCYNFLALEKSTDIVAFVKDAALKYDLHLSPSQEGQIATYTDSIRNWNTAINLTSKRALDSIATTHYLDSLSIIPVLIRCAPYAKTMADVGSGAGFPGIPLKVALPGLFLSMIEATKKKADFLAWTTAQLELDGVEVIFRRVEEVAWMPGYREAFDVVTARALASLPVALELTMPLCKVGGIVIIPGRGESQSHIEISQYAIQELGGELLELERVNHPDLPEDSIILVVRKKISIGERYPRRVGIPAKRPLSGLRK